MMTRDIANQLILGLGFVVLGNPKRYAHFYQGWGSIANGRTVTLSAVEEKRDPGDGVHLAVFVQFKEWSEAGEDLCDYHTEESRWICVESLKKYLESKGIRFRNEEEVA